jgi:hypothetical protein
MLLTADRITRNVAAKLDAEDGPFLISLAVLLFGFLQEVPKQCRQRIGQSAASHRFAAKAEGRFVREIHAN